MIQSKSRVARVSHVTSSPSRSTAPEASGLGGNAGREGDGKGLGQEIARALRDTRADYEKRAAEKSAQ
jgi:hypothetical protein